VPAHDAERLDAIAQRAPHHLERRTQPRLPQRHMADERRLMPRGDRATERRVFRHENMGIIPPQGLKIQNLPDMPAARSC
jgi:hypothetical protein